MERVKRLSFRHNHSRAATADSTRSSLFNLLSTSPVKNASGEGAVVMYKVQLVLFYPNSGQSFYLRILYAHCVRVASHVKRVSQLPAHRLEAVQLILSI